MTNQRPEDRPLHQDLPAEEGVETGKMTDQLDDDPATVPNAGPDYGVVEIDSDPDPDPAT